MSVVLSRTKKVMNMKIKILDFKNVTESFKVLSKQRPQSMRHIAIILVLCLQLGIFGFVGTSHVDYLYVRRKFDFTDENTLVRKHQEKKCILFIKIISD